MTAWWFGAYHFYMNNPSVFAVNAIGGFFLGAVVGAILGEVVDFSTGEDFHPVESAKTWGFWGGVVGAAFSTGRCAKIYYG